jgi:D-amino peptidase
MDIQLNGKSITESELVGYSWGTVGVPVIFVSGDNRLAEDLKTMPWIEYVTVKNATSASTVELRPIEEARRELKEKAAKAVKKIANAKVMKLESPVTSALRVVPPASLEMLKQVPGIDYKDNTVTFKAENFAKAYDGVIALIGVATAGYVSVTNEVINQQPNGKDLSLLIRDARMMRWLDVESGRWKVDAIVTPPPRKYYGAR